MIQKSWLARNLLCPPGSCIFHGSEKRPATPECWKRHHQLLSKEIRYQLALAPWPKTSQEKQVRVKAHNVVDGFPIYLLNTEHEDPLYIIELLCALLLHHQDGTLAKENRSCGKHDSRSSICHWQSGLMLACMYGNEMVSHAVYTCGSPFANVTRERQRPLQKVQSSGLFRQNGKWHPSIYNGIFIIDVTDMILATDMLELEETK